MTSLSYTLDKPASKQYTPAPYEIIENGTIHRFEDVISASVAHRTLGGKLYRVELDETKPHGFIRKRIQPLTLAYENGRLRCVPAFGC